MTSLNWHHHHNNTTHSLTYPQHPQNKLPEQQQRELLITRIILLSAQNNILKQRNQHLETTIGDLRALLVCAGEESLHDEKAIIKGNDKLQEQIQELGERLRNVSKLSGHLSKCSRFWQQFVK